MTTRDKGWFLLWLALPVMVGDIFYYEVLGKAAHLSAWWDKAFFFAMFGVGYLGLAKIEDWLNNGLPEDVAP